jgi:carbamoylphosphate synthase small subunit
MLVADVCVECVLIALPHRANDLLFLTLLLLQVKLPFGNRGQNQPVRNLVTGDCYITPQNHGYAIGESAMILVVVALLVSVVTQLYSMAHAVLRLTSMHRCNSSSI